MKKDLAGHAEIGDVFWRIGQHHVPRTPLSGGRPAARSHGRWGSQMLKKRLAARKDGSNNEDCMTGGGALGRKYNKRNANKGGKSNSCRHWSWGSPARDRRLTAAAAARTTARAAQKDPTEHDDGLMENDVSAGCGPREGHRSHTSGLATQPPTPPPTPPAAPAAGVTNQRILAQQRRTPT